MSDPGNETIDYYGRYADAFAVQPAALDLESLYQRFLRWVRPGGRILDPGCGPGRDALAFVERGFEVVAFDASAAMVWGMRPCASSIAAHHGAPDVVRTLVPHKTEMRALVPISEPVSAWPTSMQCYFIIPSSGRF